MPHPYLDVDDPIAIAHRGGAREAPENTAEAFERAVSLGFRYLETDAQLSADGIPIAFHDGDLDRVSTARGRVSDLSYDELSRVTVGAGDGGRIVSIDELLSLFPQANLNIDAKTDAVVAPLLDVIAKHDAWNRVCVGSFFDLRLRRVRRTVGPEVCTSCGPAEIVATMATSFFARSTKGRSVTRCALQVPPAMFGIPVVTKRFVDHAHTKGLPVHVWTIDDPDEMTRLLNLGVDGIMTDRPTVLKEVFVERGIWPS